MRRISIEGKHPLTHALTHLFTQPAYTSTDSQIKMEGVGELQQRIC